MRSSTTAIVKHAGSSARPPRPSEAASRPARRDAGAPSRRTRSSSPRRSGSRRQHAAAPRLRPLGRRELGMGTHDRAGDDLGEAPRIGIRRPPVERHEHVEPLATRRLRERARARARRAVRAARAPPRSSVTRAPRASDRDRRARSPGRSGRSTREYQAFMSMQPMFTIQSSASSSSTSGKAHDLPGRRSRRRS